MSQSKPPPLSLWLRELPYTVQILSSPLRRVKAVESNAQGKGAPVLVIPGILSNDNSTSLFRRCLDAAGYRSYASHMGFLTGIQTKVMERAEHRLSLLYEREGQPIALIGWSLGGLYARALAQRHADKVLIVITLGTPFSGDRRANNAWRFYNAINNHTVDNPPVSDDPGVKPTVRTIAIWSPNDGVIAPECARGQEGERDAEIEVPDQHFALCSDRQAINRIISILGEQLATLED